MRKFSPWTLLRRKLLPLVSELHAATPWRVCAPQELEGWVRNLSWEELWWGDEVCRLQLCRERPVLAGWPCALTLADACIEEPSCPKEAVTCQVMHRLLFAIDLSQRMSGVWRKHFDLNGDFCHDSRVVLIDAWRTSAVLMWADQFGADYLDQRQED